MGNIFSFHLAVHYIPLTLMYNNLNNRTGYKQFRTAIIRFIKEYKIQNLDEDKEEKRFFYLRKNKTNSKM